MGKIVPFERAMPKGKPVQRGEAWYLSLGIEGEHPKGHPPLAHGPRGKALLAVNQVWVEIHTDRLWVIRSIEIARKHPSYPHDVELSPYYKGHWQHIVAEATLRQTMMVWEDAIEFRIGLGAKLDYHARHDPQSPFKDGDAAADARKFFGLDRHGNRVDK